MKYCRCGQVMPQARLDLGYNKCVQCSDTQLYSYVPIIANKQVLEVQIVDQATSANVHRPSNDIAFISDNNERGSSSLIAGLDNQTLADLNERIRQLS